MLTDLWMFLLFEAAIVLAFQSGWWMFKKYGWEEAHFHGLHTHACECGWTWTHDDRDMRIGHYDEDVEITHTCPMCGAAVLEISPEVP